LFGKQDNTNTIDLSDIAYGIGGFVINGQSAGDQSGWSVSSAGDVNGEKPRCTPFFSCIIFSICCYIC
jgi:hypothetical protein